MLTIAHPIGCITDVTQLGLEMTGYKGAGKVVGVSGKTIAGTLVGKARFTHTFSHSYPSGTWAYGGPVGAVAGGLTGLGIWCVNEKFSA